MAATESLPLESLDGATTTLAVKTVGRMQGDILPAGGDVPVVAAMGNRKCSVEAPADIAQRL